MTTLGHARHHLCPLEVAISVVGPELCYPVEKKWLSKTRRQVSTLTLGASISFDVTVRDVTNGARNGDFSFRLDGLHVLRNYHNDALAVLVVNTSTKCFDVIDLRTRRCILSIARVLGDNEPTAVAKFQDRNSGRVYTLGYTGNWVKAHSAEIWVVDGDFVESQERRPVARVTPAGKLGLDESYRVDVAPGMDTGVVLLLCYVLDLPLSEVS